MADTRMHLTNYAINKDSEAFVQPEDETDCADAHKRTISSLMHTLAEEGHDTNALWNAIGEVCVKTLISVQPHLEHTYGTCRRKSDDAGSGCFELLGFDIMFDHKMRPFLLEVNHSPSFTCDSPLDASVKSAVLRGTCEGLHQEPLFGGSADSGGHSVSGGQPVAERRLSATSCTGRWNARD